MLRTFAQAMDDCAAKLEKPDMKGVLTEEEFAQQKVAVLSGEIVSHNQVAPVMMQPGMMGNQRPSSVARFASF